jgi:SpoVK/Ycf46/Vps4 family AAA+-type ATPase
VLREWRHRGKLDAAGVTRRTKFLFHGPPGCGKTITARALGGEMSLPVMVVRFDGVVGSYLGQTAARLRELFRYAEAVPSVLVLDEIDALAQRRGNPRDVGELDRVVVSLLQELEHSMPQGIVVASSNLPRALDDALWRRFDLVLDFPVPSAAQILAFARKRQVALGRRPGRDLARRLRRSRSYADAERVVTDMHRREILSREME